MTTIITYDQVVPQSIKTDDGRVIIVSTNDGIKRYNVFKGPYKGATLEHNTFTGKSKLIFIKDDVVFHNY